MATWKRGFRWGPAYLAPIHLRHQSIAGRPASRCASSSSERATWLSAAMADEATEQGARRGVVPAHGPTGSTLPWLLYWGGACRACAFGGRAGRPCVHSPFGSRSAGRAPVHPPTCSCCRARVVLPRAGCRQPAPVGRAVLACRALPCVPVPQVSVASSNSEVTAVDSPPPVRRCG